ncbi:MAG: hypothetical protein AAFV26_06865 [Pseudomonadota bacterium]
MRRTRTGRYEFRCFAPALADMRLQIEGAGVAIEREQRDETYLISPQPDPDFNIKFRAGCLEVKLRERTLRGLEFWRHIHTVPLPIDGQTLSAICSEALGRAPQITRDRGLDCADVVRLVEAAGIARGVDVFKDRRRIKIDGGLAEITTLKTEMAAVETAAVEAADPEATARLRAAFGLASATNESYPAYLGRAIA